jgi:hypothetical protein
VSWASKKQNSVSLSTAEAEYIAAGHSCVQLLWMRQTLRDYGYKFSKVPLLCDNESAIHMADNPVEHSRTKHVAEPPKLLGPHAPVLVPKTSDGYACAPDNLTGFVRLPQGHRINHLQPEPQD